MMVHLWYLELDRSNTWSRNRSLYINVCIQTNASLATRLLHIVLDGRLKRGRVGADHLSYFLAVLEEQKCGHRTYTQLLRYLWDLVHVELVEPCLGVFVGVSAICQY